MAQTPPPALTDPPDAPSRADPANFAAKGDAFLGWFATAWSDLVAAMANVYGNAVDAYNNAVSAAASAASALANALAAASSAQAAAASAGAIAWVSGTTYAVGDPRWSPADGRVYRRRTVGAGTTDPSADPANWALVATTSLQLVEVAGASQTAAVGGRYVLTNAAQSTLTAPPSPQPGDRFAVKVANGRADNLVNWSGAKHEGVSDVTMTLAGLHLSLEFVYVNATIGWVIV